MRITKGELNIMQRFENKYDLLNAVYQDENMKKGTITLFQYLVHKSNKEYCFPSVETIAKALNVCVRTVQYNMRKLEAAGYIIRKDRYYNHQQLSNQYIFNFGVCEESITAKQRYSEEDKEYLASEMGISESSNDIYKALSLQRIYEMSVGSREKLLLTYFYHKANNKGLVYIRGHEAMDAIGVSTQTYYKLLSALCRRGFLKVKYMLVSGKRLLVAKLTDYFMQQVEAQASDHKEKLRNVVQHIQQPVTGDTFPEGVQKQSGFSVWVASVAEHCYHAIHYIRNKVRKILRI